LCSFADFSHPIACENPKKSARICVKNLRYLREKQLLYIFPQILADFCKFNKNLRKSAGKKTIIIHFPADYADFLRRFSQIFVNSTKICENLREKSVLSAGKKTIIIHFPADYADFLREFSQIFVNSTKICENLREKPALSARKQIITLTTQ
jgi:hypothetical protein